MSAEFCSICNHPASCQRANACLEFAPAVARREWHERSFMHPDVLVPILLVVGIGVSLAGWVFGWKVQ